MDDITVYAEIFVKRKFSRIRYVLVSTPVKSNLIHVHVPSWCTHPQAPFLLLSNIGICLEMRLSGLVNLPHWNGSGDEETVEIHSRKLNL